MEQLPITENKLSELYYTHNKPSAYGGSRNLVKHLKLKSDKAKAHEWLSGQDAYTLHRKTNSKFLRRRTVVSGVNVQLQADLMDVSNLSESNDNIKFLLTAVDVFSKKAYVEALPSKMGSVVAPAMERILITSGVSHLQTDKGKEFYNKHVTEVVTKLGVKHFSTGDDVVKAAIVERFNRTIREKIFRHLTRIRGHRYIDILQKLVDGYNNTENSATGTTPNSITFETQEEAFLYGINKDAATRYQKQPPSLEVNDHVRVVSARMVFTRGYTPNWTEEIFQIRSINLNAIPQTYLLRDLANEEVTGIFYAQELQKVAKPTTFRVESVLRERAVGKGKRRKKQFFVKWLGYPVSMNSWVNEADIEK